MGLVDLSMSIRSTWRWPIEIGLAKDFEKGDPYRVTSLGMGMHFFTHVDTPLHIEPGRETIDQVALDRLCGPAAILDLRPVGPNREIGAGLLVERCGHLMPNDILILKSCWDRQRGYDTREYWSEAPYLSREAAAWLSELPVKAIGFDFPQDYVIREIPGRHPAAREMPTHDLILRKGILLIEYLCNLHEIKADRVEIFALPLKVAGAEGACARVVAVK
jgi:kynurenine formamidase